MDIQSKFRTEFNLIDVTAAQDATSQATIMNETLSDLTTLVTGSDYSPQATLEHNFFVLDGTMSEFQDQKTAYFSSVMSDEQGKFESNPTITITFKHNHSCMGFTWDFLDDYPRQMKITALTLYDSMITSGYIDITGNHFDCIFPCEDFGKLVIEFTKTLPGRYIKVDKLMFGILHSWEDDKITEASLVEEMDYVSNQLSINQLNFSIVDLDGLYNFGNQMGFQSFIQASQELKSYEEVNGIEHYLGKYFIDSFSEDSNQVKFTCIDFIGILDKYKFYRGKFYNGVPMYEVVDSIMSSAFITDYHIEEELKSKLVYGTIKPCTCREALREVLFACGAQADTTRSDAIEIFLPTRQIRGNIERSKKISTKVSQREYVSSVSVQYNSYSLPDSGDNSELVTGNYTKGNNLVIFDSPVAQLSTSAGQIVESGLYYCILSLDEDTTVTVSGKTYTETQITSRVTVGELEGGEHENEVSYSSTLANEEVATEIATRLLDYHQNRLELDIQYIADEETVTDWYIVKNSNPSYNNYIAGFESITTDLTSGFIATAKMFGYYNSQDGQYFTGNELYGADNIII